MHSHAVQKVEIVGNEGWWHQNGDAVILALAAITAAAVAAYVAIRNQREQLAHDRELDNQDHIRNTIDQALLAANEARNAMHRFMSSIETADAWRLADEPVPPTLEEKIPEDKDTAILKLQSLLTTQVRLEARLSETHPIATAHKEIAQAYSNILNEALDGVDELREESVRELDAEREQQGEEAFRQFQAACNTWLNG